MNGRDFHIQYLALSVLYYRKLVRTLGRYGVKRYQRRVEEYEDRLRQLADNIIVERSYLEVSRTLVG